LKQHCQLTQTEKISAEK